MKKDLVKKITEAIAGSKSRNETVDVTVAGIDSGDVIEALEEIHGPDFDYAYVDSEGAAMLDIWGWSDSTPENEQDWRINVNF